MATRRLAKGKPHSQRKKAPIKQAPPTVPTNEAAFDLFCEYMALPSVVRTDIFKHPETGEGLETQKEFADAYGLREERLSEWKRKDDYLDKVTKIRRQYFKGQLGDAIQAVMTNILVNPRGADLKVLLEYAGEVQKDDPTGEVGEQLTAILKKLNAMIPG